jgi:hypothetical protein
LTALLVAIAANASGNVLAIGVVNGGAVDVGGGAFFPSDSGFQDMFVLGIGDP